LIRASSKSVVVVASGLLAGCAALAPGPKLAPVTHGTYAPSEGRYSLSKDELTFDCTKIAGRIKIRLSSMRGAATGVKTSDTSHTMQKLSEIGEAPSRGVDAAEDRRADRAYVDAFNSQLSAKGCTPFDIDGEIKGVATPNAGRSVSGKSAPAAKAGPAPKI
jgi:hypothetical protein